MISVPQYFPYPNPSATVTSTFTFPEPEPEVGYDDKKSAKENLARAMFEIAKQLRLSREQARQPSTPVWPATQPPAYPWWPLQQSPYPKEWEPYITCSTIGACNDR